MHIVLVAAAVAQMALVQYDADSHFSDYDANVAALTAYAERAAAAGAKVIVFPEGSTFGYVGPDETWCSGGQQFCYDRACRDVGTVAEPLPGGKTTAHWQDFARAHDAYVVYSMLESDHGRYYNAVGVVGPQGFVTKYRKRVLYGPDYCYATEGRTEALFTTPFGKFGLGICADGNEDELYQSYKDQGANAVVIPMDWDQDPGSGRAARVFFQEKARRNQIDVYAADAPAWDGTAKYPAGARIRERDGLPPVAVGEEGMSLHPLTYSGTSPLRD